MAVNRLDYTGTGPNKYWSIILGVIIGLFRRGHFNYDICDQIGKIYLISGWVKIDFFPQKAFTLFKYCVRKI